MAVQIRVPEVGESVAEALISQWFKSEGDRVSADEPLCSLETDKVTVDLPSPATGVVQRIAAREGTTVAVGDVIGEIAEAGEAEARPAGDGEAKPKAKAAPAGREAAKPAAAEVRESPAPARKPAEEKRKAAAAEPVAEPAPAAREPEGDVVLSPRARRLAQLHPAGAAEASAPQILQQTEAKRPAGEQARKTEARAPEPRPAPTREGAHDRTERVPMTPLRRRVATRLVQAQQTAAILTTFNEVDMSQVLALRQEHQPRFQERYGIKLGFMSFFVKACIEALKAFPAVNAMIDGDDIVYRNYFDIGVAVGGGKGLVVPVIRDADRLSLAGVERAVADYGERARANKLSLEELQGGTFTISNGGVYGSLLSTPILNPPQSGILGMHKIEKRPVVVDDAIVIRPMMYLALSYDHRLVDGREAVSFLIRTKECIEAPERLLLEV